jgi:2-hydroxychromene-2-carboxylate isomerase
VVFRFSGIDPAALFGAVGKEEKRQRGGENAEENLSPERGVFCIFAYDSAVPKMRKGL